MKSEIVERIKELREKGMGYKKIAKALNISLSTVQYWCNDKFREKVKERAKNYRKVHLERVKQNIKSYRKRYPEKYNYIMARYFLRKLDPEKRKELFNEFLS